MAGSQNLGAERCMSDLQSEKSLLRDVIDPLTMVRGLVKEGCTMQDAQRMIFAYYGRVYDDTGGGESDMPKEDTLSKSSRSVRSQRYFSRADEWLVKPGYCYTTILRPSRRQDIAKKLGPDIRLDQVLKLPFGAIAWHRIQQLYVTKIDNWHVHLSYDQSQGSEKAIQHFAAFAADFPVLVPSYWLEALSDVMPTDDGWFGMTTVFGSVAQSDDLLQSEQFDRLPLSASYLDTDMLQQYHEDTGGLRSVKCLQVHDFGYVEPESVREVPVQASFSVHFLTNRWYRFVSEKSVVLRIHDCEIGFPDGTHRDFVGIQGGCLFSLGKKQPFKFLRVSTVPAIVYSLSTPGLLATDYSVAVKLDVIRVWQKLFSVDSSAQLYLPRDVSRLLGVESYSEVGRSIVLDSMHKETYTGTVLVRFRDQCLQAAREYPRATVRHMQSIIGVRCEQIVLQLYDRHASEKNWSHSELSLAFSRHTLRMHVVGIDADTQLRNLFSNLLIAR